jgi:hypothetical protein
MTGIELDRPRSGSGPAKPGDLPASIVACDAIGRGVPMTACVAAIVKVGVGVPVAADADNR